MRPSDAQLRPCPCGGSRARNKIVCFPCWNSAPEALRKASHTSRTRADAIEAARNLITHARSRVRQPDLL